VRSRLKALLPFAVLAGLGVLVIVLVLIGAERAAAVAAAVLVTAVAVLAFDLWARTRDVQHMLRLSAERQHELGARLGALLDDEGDASTGEDRRNNLVARLEATERRLLATLEAERLRAADDRAALAAEVAAFRAAARQDG
jgi:hypothetical protein